MKKIKAVVTYEEVKCGNCNHTLGTINSLEEFCKEKGSECYNLENGECYDINKACKQCSKVNVFKFTAYVELNIDIKTSMRHCIDYTYKENFFRNIWFFVGEIINAPYFKKEYLISKENSCTVRNRYLHEGCYIDDINRFTIKNEGEENCTVMLKSEE